MLGFLMVWFRRPTQIKAMRHAIALHPCWMCSYWTANLEAIRALKPGDMSDASAQRHTRYWPLDLVSDAWHFGFTALYGPHPGLAYTLQPGHIITTCGRVTVHG